MSHTLKSVNWLTGMLLTPQHFEQQDQFVDGAAAWLVRYAMEQHGLVGGGLRVDPQRNTLTQFDPQLDVRDTGDAVQLALLFARGITPGGDAVDVSEPDVLRAELPKSALAGVTEALVYVVRTGIREEDPGSVGLDAANPHQAALRRPQYVLRVGLTPDQATRALVVGRVRRVSETLGFDRDGGYIPPCAAGTAHSALYAGWTRLRDDVVYLAGRYAELHATVAAYAEQIAMRGVDVRGDLDTLAFVERAVLALDECAYGVLDPSRPPAHLFQYVERLGRRVAIALDLSAATRMFLRSVSVADAGYDVLLDAERRALARRRGWDGREDVNASMETARETVSRVLQLCEALEGKYVDYRVNRTVDALRFLLERGGEGFYSSVATPAHPRRDGDLLTFDFAPLSLPGRQEYRILLVGDAQGGPTWQVGEQFSADVWVNPGAGGGRPISETLRVEVPAQRNFAVTFNTPPELGQVVALRVSVHEPGYRIRRAVLYQRGRGVVADMPVALGSGAPMAAPAFVPAAPAFPDYPPDDRRDAEALTLAGSPAPPPVVQVIKKIPLKRPLG